MHVSQPLLAQTATIRSPVAPSAFDCVKLIIVRDGSAFLFSEFGRRPVHLGDAILLGANTLCGVEPEGPFTLTTIYLDTDYVIDQVYWQHAALLHDRLDAQEFAAKLYTEPAQILRLGEQRVHELAPTLDELVELSDQNRPAENFNRMQHLWFLIAEAITPFVTMTPIRVSPTQRGRDMPSEPRFGRFAPLRDEAREAAELLRSTPERRWTVGELAGEVHLSRAQMFRVFHDAFGKTPIAFLTRVRAERMATLLRSTDAPVADIARQVGWSDPVFASRQFRRNIGATPSEYRKAAWKAAGERRVG